MELRVQPNSNAMKTRRLRFVRFAQHGTEFLQGTINCIQEDFSCNFFTHWNDGDIHTFGYVTSRQRYFVSLSPLKFVLVIINEASDTNALILVTFSGIASLFYLQGFSLEASFVIEDLRVVLVVEDFRKIFSQEFASPITYILTTLRWKTNPLFVSNLTCK